MAIPDAETRKTLPLSDFRSTKDHDSDDCNLELCNYCGCCVHGKQMQEGCRVELAEYGMECPNRDCGCTGKVGY